MGAVEDLYINKLIDSLLKTDQELGTSASTALNVIHDFLRIIYSIICFLTQLVNVWAQLRVCKTSAVECCLKAIWTW